MGDDPTVQGPPKTQGDGHGNGVFAGCSFTDLGLNPTLSDQLKERLGFIAPTLIQEQTIPLILSGRHVLVNAGTGTGKTIVYLAPIVHHLQAYIPRINRSDGTFALLLVPTRELCMQVYEVLQKLLHRFHWLVPGYITGGENRSKEKARLRKGITILVATPGRLLDHLKHTSSFVHNRLRWLVFDEADRLLDLGFGRDIKEILTLLEAGNLGFVNENTANNRSFDDEYQRQNLLLSATLNEEVNDLAKISLNNPVTVGLKERIFSQGKTKLYSGLSAEALTNEWALPGTCSSASEYRFPAKLVQSYIKVPCRLRFVVLLALLRSQFEAEPSRKVVVFFSTCDSVDFHYAAISDFHWVSHFQEVDEEKGRFIKCKTFRLHGNMAQAERKETFHGYNEEKCALLLCTDVAARGLDFPKVGCIIQYDSPGDANEYVHRVGRTARLDQEGEAVLFLQPIELDYLKELQKHGVPLNELSVQNVLDHIQVRGRTYNKQAKWSALDMHPGALAMQKALESFIMMEESMKQLAKDAFCSFVRAYAAHRGDLKKIFQVKQLHLGHVAKSFGLKDQPSLVGKSFNKQAKKRERSQKFRKGPKKMRLTRVTSVDK